MKKQLVRITYKFKMQSRLRIDCVTCDECYIKKHVQSGNISLEKRNVIK